MLNSRDINRLRLDVAKNCKIWLDECRKQGLNPLVTGTVRDKDYQMLCYNNGYSKSKTPSFHSVKAGLAFDFCKNVKGDEFNDIEFFEKCGAIAEKMGFEWGGRWTKFKDMPHIQWSQYGRITSGMVREGIYPNPMPYKGDLPMLSDSNIKQITELIERTVKNILNEKEAAEQANIEKVSVWAINDWKFAINSGIMQDTRPRDYATREELATVVARLLHIIYE